MRRAFRWMVCLLLVAPRLLLAAGFHGESNTWVYIDNGVVRLGVRTDSGAGIAWFSASGSPRNLINHFDRGRLIQQSYYGDKDGSTWNGKPWRWNPVQGGDWKGRGAKILSLTNTATTLESITRPVNWGGGEDIADVLMAQRIVLTGRLAHIRFAMSYSGTNVHRVNQHEVPAVFMAPDLKTLVLYDGPAPWTGGALSRSQPGWPNEGRKMTEHWAAYVDDRDYGLGVCVPIANKLTCYRFEAGRGSCSYFAPLTSFPIKPGLVFSYDVYLAIGASDQLRELFRTRPGSKASSTGDPKQ